MNTTHYFHGSLSKWVFRLCVLSTLTLFLAVQSPKLAFASSTEQGPPGFSALAEKVKHSVVNISTTVVVEEGSPGPLSGPESPFKHFFGDIPRGEMKTHALGSGLIISDDGLILTNNHVVEKATEIKVKLDTGKEYDAKVVGRDPKTDLALIRVKPDGDFPRPARLGDSDAIKVGDWVMAVGNPFGLGHTATVGIISAKSRIIGAGPYDDFLQTDAAINPGNSGGPLFNMAGEVVGINTAIVAQGQGIGFAIPINLAKELLPQLKTGKVIRGWLGVMIQDVSAELAKSFHLKEQKGVLITDVVKGSPAEKAGLRRGDVVKTFEGKDVDNAHMLSRLVAAVPPGTETTIEIIRDGETKRIDVTIGTMPAKEGEQPVETEQAPLGLQVQDLTPQLAEQLGLNPEDRGVIISNVDPMGPAAAAGLRPGDLIEEVNRQTIDNVEEFSQALKKVEKGESVLLLIKRRGGTFYVVVKRGS